MMGGWVGGEGDVVEASERGGKLNGTRAGERVRDSESAKAAKKVGMRPAAGAANPPKKKLNGPKLPKTGQKITCCLFLIYEPKMAFFFKNTDWCLVAVFCERLKVCMMSLQRGSGTQGSVQQDFETR
jgi:hypothetical protein